MRIKINGEDRELPAEFTLAALLEILQMDPRYLAVERNRQLVPRTQHAQCRLEEGDELEIVTLVGGG